MDYFRLEGAFDRLGHIGIAVRGRARSAILFSVKPIRQLDGAVIAVTEQTSTTLALLRLVLEKRYQLYPAAYERRPYAEQRRENVPPQAPERRREPDADALLLIGDEALRFRQTNKQYPFETDLAFEWWLWQHLPFVFAVWAVRKDADAQDRKHLEAALMRSLAVNIGQFDAIAQEESARLKLPAEELSAYLAGFVYRLSHAEAEGLKKFRGLADEHHLL